MCNLFSNVPGVSVNSEGNGGNSVRGSHVVLAINRTITREVSTPLHAWYLFKHNNLWPKLLTPKFIVSTLN